MEVDGHLGVIEALGEDLEKRLHRDERVPDLVRKLGGERTDGRETGRLLQHASALVELRRRAGLLSDQQEVVRECLDLGDVGRAVRTAGAPRADDEEPDRPPAERERHREIAPGRCEDVSGVRRHGHRRRDVALPGSTLCNPEVEHARVGAGEARDPRAVRAVVVALPPLGLQRSKPALEMVGERRRERARLVGPRKRAERSRQPVGMIGPDTRAPPAATKGNDAREESDEERHEHAAESPAASASYRACWSKRPARIGRASRGVGHRREVYGLTAARVG